MPKFDPFTSMVNGTLFVGALFGVSELIASGPVIAVVKVAFVAAGSPHATVRRVKQQILREDFRNSMSQPCGERADAMPEKEHSLIWHCSQHASLEVAGCFKRIAQYRGQRLAKHLEVTGIP